MTEDTPKRRSPCAWIARDDEGRPRCVHGWATLAGGDRWRCPEAHRRAARKYKASSKGRQTQKKWRQSPAGAAAYARYAEGRGKHRVRVEGAYVRAYR